MCAGRPLLHQRRRPARGAHRRAGARRMARAGAALAAPLPRPRLPGDAQPHPRRDGPHEHQRVALLQELGEGPLLLRGARIDYCLRIELPQHGERVLAGLLQVPGAGRGGRHVLWTGLDVSEDHGLDVGGCGWVRREGGLSAQNCSQLDAMPSRRGEGRNR